MAKTIENSGGSCSYYKVFVEIPYHQRKPYSAECGEIVDALGLNNYEANIFKELWRTAMARKGFVKQGNTEKRAYNKILWNAERLLEKITHKERDIQW